MDLYPLRSFALTLLKVYGEGANQDRDPERVVVVWPERSPRELPAEAPTAVADLYREASVAENAGAMRGAAGLYRAVVEELVKDRGAVGKDLYQRIGSLQSMGVSADLVEDLHEARLLGNWSLHDGVVFSADEVADVAKLIEDAVEELYVQPARRLQMQQARAGRRQTHGQTTPPAPSSP